MAAQVTGQEPNARTPRSSDFYFIAYYLSRYGWSTDSGLVNPPQALGAAGWNEAYDFFYDAVSDGRDRLRFRRSLKNARDSYDSHFGESGRVGWRETDTSRSPARLSEIANQIVVAWGNRSEAAVYRRVAELVRNAQTNNSRELPRLRPAQLGRGEPVRGRSSNRGQRSDRAYMIGREAEQWVMEHLDEYVGGSIQNLRHHPTYGETPGYDISYIDQNDRTQAIEVKGTGDHTFTSFELTANELHAAKHLGVNYTIWLITNVGNNPTPFTISDPYSQWELGKLIVTPSAWNVRGFATV